MKRIFFFLIFSMTFLSCSSGQGFNEIPKDSSINILDFIWKLDKNKIYDYQPNGNYFYRLVVISISEGESNLEGEVYEQIFLLKGEYGEYPSGKLFNIGKKYNLIDCEFKNDSLTIKYGEKNKPIIEKYSLP